MMGNTFGRLFRVTTCGESYSGAFRKNPDIPSELWGGLAVIVDGVPAGITLTADIINGELDKRRPGQSKLQTPRKEKDNVFIFSGVMQNNVTTGAPVCMIILSSDIGDYHIAEHTANKDLLRPGQAAFTYFKKYGEHADYLGAGRASARETAARVAGGAVAKQVLDAMGIDVIAYTVESHGIKAGPFTYEQAKANYRSNDINCPDQDIAKLMIEDMISVMKQGDSCGGVVEIIAKNVPAGLGEPVFDKLSAILAHGLMSIGGVKGIEIGAGFGVSAMKGSECNDTPYFDHETKKIRFRTNRAGGMLGGVSNGEEIRIRVAVKPTPTIVQEQKTINVATLEEVTHKFTSRSDPSLVPRVYPICEAMVRMTLLDSIMMFEAAKSITNMDTRWDNL